MNARDAKKIFGVHGLVKCEKCGIVIGDNDAVILDDYAYQHNRLLCRICGHHVPKPRGFHGDYKTADLLKSAERETIGTVTWGKLAAEYGVECPGDPEMVIEIYEDRDGAIHVSEVDDDEWAPVSREQAKAICG